MDMTRNIKIYIIASFTIVALFIGLSSALAQLSDIPALIRTTIPTGDPDSGRISYTIALGEGRELRITVDAGRLVVTVSGAVKDQFKIFRVDDGEFTALECSAGFLGALVGNVTCRDVESGTRLAFVRKDLVDELVPEATAAEEVETEAEEFVFDEAEIAEEEPSWFDNVAKGVADFFGFGGDEGEISGDEFSADEFAFESEDELSGAAGEDELVFGDGEAFVEEEAVIEKEGLEGEEERLLLRIWRKVREAAEFVQNKVADAIIKFYVKPPSLSSETEEGSLFFDDETAEDVSIDEEVEFFEEPTQAKNQAAPAATVNQVFQQFINGLR